MPEAGHHGVHRVGLVPLPVPLHRRVQSNRGGSPLCHVEEHRERSRLPRQGRVRRRWPISRLQRPDTAQDELCRIQQRPVLRAADIGHRHHMPHRVFRADRERALQSSGDILVRRLAFGHHGHDHLHHRARLLPHQEVEVPGGQNRPPAGHLADRRGVRAVRLRHVRHHRRYAVPERLRPQSPGDGDQLPDHRPGDAPVAVRGGDHLPHHLPAGARPDQAGPASGRLPHDGQSHAVDHLHVRDAEGRGQSRAAGLLRVHGVDRHRPGNAAAQHLLQIPLVHHLRRSVEELVQECVGIDALPNLVFILYGLGNRERLRHCFLFSFMFVEGY